jgi:hypothetical protein
MRIHEVRRLMALLEENGMPRIWALHSAIERVYGLKERQPVQAGCAGTTPNIASASLSEGEDHPEDRRSPKFIFGGD